MILEKNRKTDDVMFIDASKGFEKQKNNNLLRQQDIDLIIETYLKHEDVDKYAHVATFDEIKENDFNLNIPRYVDTFEEEEPIDLHKVDESLIEIDKEINESKQTFNELYQQLVSTEE